MIRKFLVVLSLYARAVTVRGLSVVLRPHECGASNFATGLITICVRPPICARGAWSAQLLGGGVSHLLCHLTGYHANASRWTCQCSKYHFENIWSHALEVT